MEAGAPQDWPKSYTALFLHAGKHAHLCLCIGPGKEVQDSKVYEGFPGKGNMSPLVPHQAGAHSGIMGKVCFTQRSGSAVTGRSPPQLSSFIC